MPEVIEVTCVCGKTIRAKAEHAGKTGRCSGCGEAVEIPILGLANVEEPAEIKPESPSPVSVSRGAKDAVTKSHAQLKREATANNPIRYGCLESLSWGLCWLSPIVGLFSFAVMGSGSSDRQVRVIEMMTGAMGVLAAVMFLFFGVTGLVIVSIAKNVRVARIYTQPEASSD